jgi:hypothetical protein
MLPGAVFMAPQRSLRRALALGSCTGDVLEVQGAWIAAHAREIIVLSERWENALVHPRRCSVQRFYRQFSQHRA